MRQKSDKSIFFLIHLLVDIDIRNYIMFSLQCSRTTALWTDYLNNCPKLKGDKMTNQYNLRMCFYSHVHFYNMEIKIFGTVQLLLFSVPNKDISVL